MNEDPFYDTVAIEIQQKRLKPGLWTRSYAEADGDQTKARVIYIRERVAQLKQEALAAAQSQQEGERQSQKEQREQERIAERKRAEDDFNHQYATDPLVRFSWLIPVIIAIIAGLYAWLRPK